MALRYLVDKSALARAHYPQVRRRLAEILAEDLVVTCPVIDLELLYSARSPKEYEVWRADRRVGYESLPLTPEVGQRALEVQRALSTRSAHRAAGIADLLIAACAEVHGVAIMHYDSDFDTIAAVTGQKVEWVVPRGSAG